MKTTRYYLYTFWWPINQRQKRPQHSSLRVVHSKHNRHCSECNDVMMRTRSMIERSQRSRRLLVALGGSIPFMRNCDRQEGIIIHQSEYSIVEQNMLCAPTHRVEISSARKIRHYIDQTRSVYIPPARTTNRTGWRDWSALSQRAR